MVGAAAAAGVEVLLGTSRSFFKAALVGCQGNLVFRYMRSSCQWDLLLMVHWQAKVQS
jgi:hypothetical protein